MYVIKEIFYTLQGEGANTGRPAVFCRFSGCNLWSGLENDRGQAICQFCDTDFRGTDGPGGGEVESAAQLANAVRSAWRGTPTDASRPLVVCTGGEPLLQLDEEAIESLHQIGFDVAVETNGTIQAPRGIDWLCVSPKANTDVIIRFGDELKLVYPQPDLLPSDVEGWGFEHFYLQPMDGPCVARNTEMAVEYTLQHPQWRLSIQTHKILGIA